MLNSYLPAAMTIQDVAAMARLLAWTHDSEGREWKMGCDRGTYWCELRWRTHGGRCYQLGRTIAQAVDAALSRGTNA